MALSTLSGDEQRIIFSQLSRNPLDARVAVAFSSVSNELRELTQADRQPLKAGYQAAAALGRKAGMQSCKELREAKMVDWCDTGLSSDDLALLGTLGSVLPALKSLWLSEHVTAASPPARSFSASRCTPSGTAAAALRPSVSSAGSTEPSVPSSNRSSE